MEDFGLTPFFNGCSVADALSSIVRLRIPQGDRPSLEEIRSQAAGLAGITGLMELMVKCWEAKVDKRPSSLGKRTTHLSLVLE